MTSQMAKWFALCAVVLAVLVLVACGRGRLAETPRPILHSSEATDTNALELPDGWRRVQVRTGFVGRELGNPLAGFTIDLPPGWRAGESWPSSQGPTGWIAGVSATEDEDIPTLRFYVGAGFMRQLDELERDPRNDVRHVTVEGEPTILLLAAPDAIDKGNSGIFYEQIPSGPPGKQTPSLRIEGGSRGFTDQELLGRVLTSVRYEEISELPPLPTPVGASVVDWQRIPVRSDYPSFTLKLPSGWETTNLQGYDTLVGRISGDDITLTYDFGGFAGPMYDHASEVRKRSDVPHMIWEERIGDGLFWFARPVSPEPDERGFTGVFVEFERSQTPDRISVIGAPRVAVFTTGLRGPQQELVLAMLRTIEPER